MKFVKIIVEIEEGTVVVIPVIFPNAIVHKDMAESVEELCKKYWPKAKTIKTVSAGDFVPGFDSKTGGKSTSLNLGSSFEDKVHIFLNDQISVIRRP